MTKSDIASHAYTDFTLSPEAEALIPQLLQGETVTEGEPGLSELVSLGVAVVESYSDQYVLADTAHARRTHQAAERAAIVRHLDRMTQLDRAFGLMENAAALGAGGIEFLSCAGAANAVFARALASATSHIYTAQPIPRPVSNLEISATRDIENLRRGLVQRTIYNETARSRKPEREYAKKVSAHGAQVRTLAGDFIRIVLIDNKVAIVSDYRDDPPNKDVGFKITHPGMLAFLAIVFKQQWERATPWMGERSRTHTEGTITTQRTRAILRKLEGGRNLKQVASDLGYSLSTVNGEIAELYRATNTSSQFTLGAWWASSDERKLD
jgi:DNA-binding CsgD family transcriptional regulator